MGNLLTNEIFVNKLTKIHGNKFTALTAYEKYNKHILVKCNDCGQTFSITPNNLLKPTRVCKFCGNGKGKQHQNTFYTTEEYIEKARQIHGDEFIYDKTIYVNRNTPIIVGCKKHGYFEVLPYIHLKFRGCHECAKEEHIDPKKLTNEDFIKRAKIIHGDKYEYLSEYVNMQTPIRIKCKICGKIFKQTPHKHLSAKHGCPKCLRSKLEERISLLLKNEEIKFISQANNKILPWIGKQSLDFYIPSKNVAIECQGKQHFKPIDYFGGENEYNKIIKRDLNKKKICLEHGIKILYFSDIKYNDDIFIEENELLKEISY